MTGKNQHVVPHKGGWAVKGEGNTKVTSIQPTQSKAAEVARSIVGLRSIVADMLSPSLCRPATIGRANGYEAARQGL